MYQVMFSLHDKQINGAKTLSQLAVLSTTKKQKMPIAEVDFMLIDGTS
jgi:hypothetical protein